MSLAVVIWSAAAAVVGQPPQHRSATECRAMARPVAQWEVVAPGDTEAVACSDDALTAKLGYDRRSGTVRARTPLVQGENIGRVWWPVRPQVLPGDKVRVLAKLGRVAVSREVTALQAAKPGQRFFAMGSDGKIFSAPPLRVEGS